MSNAVRRRYVSRILAVGAVAATPLAISSTPVVAEPGQITITTVCTGADEASQEFLNVVSPIGALPIDLVFDYDVPTTLLPNGSGPVSFTAGVTLSQAVIDAAEGFGVAAAELSNIELAGSTSGPGTVAPPIAISDAGPYTIDFADPVVPTFTTSGTVTAGDTEGTILYNYDGLTVTVTLIDSEGIPGLGLNLTCAGPSQIAATNVGQPTTTTTAEVTTTTASTGAVTASPRFTG